MNGGTLDSADSLADALERALADKELIHKSHHGPGRQRLRDAALRLSTAMETQADSINRIRDTPLQVAMAKVGINKGLFEILASAQDKGLTNAALAEKTGIDPNLLKRILRYLQSIGTISQPENDLYVANNVTEALASVQGRTAITHNMITMAPVFLALPEYFEKNGYKPITDILDTPFQLAHQTTLDPWAWGQEKPERYEAFLAWMMHARDNLPVFVDVLDDMDQAYFANTDDQTVLFVDVGGSRGPIATKVRQKYAHVPGRVVLQDQDYVIAAAQKEPLAGFDKIETQVIDFFAAPNPLRGARVYYLRNILHDWSDQKCLEILANVRPAMVAGQSTLLIDELVLPEKQAPLRESQLDIEMFTHLSGAERTEEEWRTLLGNAGFQVKRVRRYGNDRHDSVIEAIPRNR